MNPLRALYLSLSRIPPVVMLVIIVGLAASVSLMVSSALSTREHAMADKEREMNDKLHATGKVVFAVKDIPEGQTISSEALEERSIELNKVPQDAITSSSLAAGRLSKYGISQGMIVSQHDLAPQGVSIGFEALLKNGMRAITFAVDNNTGVAGFITPQSRVDIIGMAGAGSETKAAPILSDIQVIAVGQTYQKNPGGTTAMPASSITVAVSPTDAQKLVKAILAGKLYLALRGDSDHTPLATVDITSLFNNKQPAGRSNEAMGMQTILPPPPPLSDMNLNTAPAAASALSLASQPPRPKHEIEIWSAGKRDVLELPLSTN